MPVIINEELKNSEEMQDIITAVPGWLIRWGISLFFCILLLLVSFGALIRYPDIIRTQLKIRLHQAPEAIVVKTSGKIRQLQVAQYSTVKAGQQLAGFEDSSKPGVVTKLIAPCAGTVIFSAFAQENQLVDAGQEIFYITTGNASFFGEMQIAQANMGKIKLGQEVLVKLSSYPFEEYGTIHGRVNYIAELPYRDSIFMARVGFRFPNSPLTPGRIHLKQGMTGEADIITADATIFQRLSRGFIRLTGRN